MAVVQIAAMLTVACDSAAPAVAAPAAWVTAAAARALVRSADMVEWWPWLALRTPPPAWWAAAGYLAAVAAALAARQLGGLSPRSRVRMWRGSVGLAVGLGAWIVSAPGTWRWPWRADGRLRVVMLDVGQGDATLVEFPGGERWLVDAGGLPGATYDIGERVVAPALWARGTGRLDALVLTHGDPDHVGGARAAIDDFRPAVHEGVPVPGHVPTRLLREHARAGRRPWRTIAAPAAWAVGGVAVRAWHPPAPDWERRRVRNDDSVVLELRYGTVSIVLPGDISAEVERALAPLMPGAPRRVLKAAHHGSATSTSDAWLDALRPEVVVVSCGRDNRYGHPAAAVSGRLVDRGIETFRTDEDGQVVVDTDGADVRVSTFTGGHVGTTSRGGNRDTAMDRRSAPDPGRR
jgi:competence protein ComEC